MLQSSVRILCGQPGQHGNLLRHRLAAEGEVCHLAGRVLHVFQIFDQLTVFFVLAQGKHFPVHTGGAHPGDLVQQQLPHSVRHIAFASEQDAAAAVHPQHLAAKAGVHKAFVIQAAVQRRHPAHDAAEHKVVQRLGAQIVRRQRLFLKAYAEAGLGNRHGQRFFRGGKGHGLRGPQPLHLFCRAGLHQAVPLAGGKDLLHGGVASRSQHHIARGIKGLAAVVQHGGRDLGNALHRARDIAADGVAVVQALEQAGDEPPVRAVIVHFDFLPDDALLLGDGLLGKVGVAYHAQQHVQAFVQLLGGGEQVAGAVKAGKGVGVGTGLCVLGKGIAVLVLEHFVLQKMRHARRQMHRLPVQAEIPVDGAELCGIDHMGAGIARHGAHQHRQAGGQSLPLVGHGLFQQGLVILRHGQHPPL